jgi:hypothetical protein
MMNPPTTLIVCPVARAVGTMHDGRSVRADGRAGGRFQTAHFCSDKRGRAGVPLQPASFSPFSRDAAPFANR